MPNILPRCLALSCILAVVACDDEISEPFTPDELASDEAPTPADERAPVDDEDIDESLDESLDRQGPRDESEAYCIPQTWSGGCTYMMNYACCPPSVPYGTCSLYKCKTNLLDSDCSIKVTEHLKYDGCANG
jgi:hypothetical protein